MFSNSNSILIVDDDPELRNLMKDILEDQSFQVTVARDGNEALSCLEDQEFLVVLTDLRMKGMDGAELLQEIVKNHPTSNVIMMTAFGSVESAVEAMKRGAFDYLTKPVKTDELLVTIDKALREAMLRQEVAQLRKPMEEVFDLIRRVADTQTNILITGESGTGKELVAKAIHFNSGRKHAPFVPVNCAAIPEFLLESELFGHMKGSFTDAKSDKRGLFEEAHKGTIFLDEISEMPMMLQAKLLRAVQEREIRRVGATRSVPVDVRIIAATNLHLAEEVKAKRFREDLYYRLNVIEIRLPPLRERKEDIPLLCDMMLEKSSVGRQKEVTKISEAALGLLLDYGWPGNVRELENIMERAVTLAQGAVLTPNDLPQGIRDAQGDRYLVEESTNQLLSLEGLEHLYIQRMLEKTKGNKFKAAQLLGIDRKTLYRKLSDMQKT
jgi:DNA-binding NtrC family response regulator